MSRQFHDIRVKAGGLFPLEHGDQCFEVTFSPSIVEIKWTGAGWGQYDQGDGEDLRPSGGFKRLEIRNPTTVDIDVTIWTGPAPRASRRSAIIELPSEITALDIAELGPGAHVELLGVPSGKQFRRKQIVVTNKDPNAELELRMANGLVFSTIPPKQSHNFPVSGYMRVHNPTGAPIALNVGEVWSMLM